jgi:hypothetical protein
LFRNVDWLSADYMALYSKRQYSSALLTTCIMLLSLLGFDPEDGCHIYSETSVVSTGCTALYAEGRTSRKTNSKHFILFRISRIRSYGVMTSIWTRRKGEHCSKIDSGKANTVIFGILPFGPIKALILLPIYAHTIYAYIYECTIFLHICVFYSCVHICVRLYVCF